MAILVSMIIPISGAVSRNRTKAKARAELEQVATAIELYKAKLGHYPPDNPGRPSTNQLYFELLGTIFTNGIYTTLDGSASVRSADLGAAFGGSPAGFSGFINSSQGVVSDEGRTASSFLKGLKPGQIATIYNSGIDQVKLLISSVPAPPGQFYAFYYVSSTPTNNPNGYDLWVDFVINGKTNRVSNWSQQTLILP